MSRSRSPSSIVQWTTRGLRAPAGAQVAQVVRLSDRQAPDRRRDYPPAERIDELASQRDVAGLLALRDDVLLDLANGTVSAADAIAGAELLERIQAAVVALAGTGTVAMSDRHGGRQAARELPLADRLADARRALAGERDDDGVAERVGQAKRSLSRDTRQDAELSRRTNEAREALGLRPRGT